MWVPALVSWPLAWILDGVAGKEDKHGIFTNEQLAILIKYHERAEKHGGMLGPDATRIILGALDLDGRRIGGMYTLSHFVLFIRTPENSKFISGHSRSMSGISWDIEIAFLYSFPFQALLDKSLLTH